MLKLIPRNPFSFFTAFFLCLLLVWGKCNHDFKFKTTHSITWDVYGYYLYLPSTLIYQDPGLEKTEWLDRTQHLYSPSPYIYQYSSGQGNRKVNTYPMGLAICYAPGFLVAHAIAKTGGFPADGFSAPYQWALVISSMLFFCLGVLLLRRLLLTLFSDSLTAVLIALVCLGSNYFFEAGLDSTMPHNYMFVLNCLLLLFTSRWHETFRIRYALFLGIILGVATISRPTELIWLLVPLCWGVYDKQTLVAKLHLLRTHYIHILVFALALILTGSPQLIYWKWCTGHWFSFNHNERFAFTEPYTWDFLFSYKKGWLLYTPLMVFALLGFYSLYRNRRELFYPFLLFIIVNVYVLSSWECWWYASSFSQRPMVESYPLLAIPLGFLIAAVWKRGGLIRGLTMFLLFATLVLNLFQTWQAAVSILDMQRMTKAYYWKIFGKTQVKEEDRNTLLEVDRSNWQGTFNGKENDFSKKIIFYRGYEDTYTDTDMHFVTDTLFFDGKHGLKLDSVNAFAPGIGKPFNELTNRSYAWIRMSAAVYPVVNPEISNSAFVACIESNGRVTDFITYDLKQAGAKTGQWNIITFDYLTPHLFHRYDKITLYYLNLGKKPVFIDAMKFELWEPKQEP
ncbi:MAG TPA: hypothetical protein VNZ86_15180 [Bacteroidia bacterium]|jgi:hypothetical protein|nr:hypothetical protein [Bacteroidia bacterium]